MRKAVVTGTPRSIKIEIGPWDEDRFEGRGGFQFGMTAEVWVRTQGFGSSAVEATVSIGGIGAHDADVAVQRANVYLEAAAIAKRVDYLASQGWDMVEVAAAFYEGRIGIDADEVLTFVDGFDD